MALISPETSGLRETKGRKWLSISQTLIHQKAACSSLKTLNETQWISFIFVLICRNTLLAIILKSILNTCTFSCSVDDVDNVAC